MAGLQSLSSEILYQIVKHLVEHDNKNKRERTWHDDIKLQRPPPIPRQNIRNLRLVNKKLYNVASQEFMPKLRICINEESLARAEEIVSIAAMASGVREVVLMVAYCPDNWATSLTSFAQYRLQQLAGMCHHINYNWRFGTPSYADVEEVVDEEDLERKYYLGASQSWDGFRYAWEVEFSLTWLGEDTERTVDEKEEEEANRRILRQGFERFQSLHRQQHRLITSGEFATKVASFVSRLPNASSVCLVDENDFWDDEQSMFEMAETFLDKEKVITKIAKPISWSANIIEHGFNDDDLYDPNGLKFPTVAAAALLWDVPVAMHRAGVALRDYSIHCFPFSNSFELGSCEGGFLKGSEDEFRSAVSALQSFCFLPSMDCVNDNPGLNKLSVNEGKQIVRFLELCTSSNKLEALEMKLQYLECSEKNKPSLHNTYLDITSVLNNIDNSNWKNFRMEFASCSQDAIYQVFSRSNWKGASRSLYNVYIFDGGWAGVLELLRSTACSVARRHPGLVFVSSCESKEMYEYYQDGPEKLLPWQLRWILESEKPIDERDFVMGKTDINPHAKYCKPPRT